jgi:hypothetical protein
MVAILLFLLAFLGASPASQPAPLAEQPVVAARPPATSAAALLADELGAPPPDLAYRSFLPIIANQPTGCQPIPGVQYISLSTVGPPTDRPAEQHADLNLALRGYQVTSAYLGLVSYGPGEDPRAPQLNTLFGDGRLPAFTTAYRVYDWNWACNCRGGLITQWPVTLLGLGVTPGEVLRLPDSGYDIGQGYDARVLYATQNRLTLKYTREDNVVSGYTLHLENVCVEPSLLALYRAWNDAGRAELPALRAGQPLGRAMGPEVGVAIRDNGSFMDTRSRNDWWRSK